MYSHAEGIYSRASGYFSHAEGSSVHCVQPTVAEEALEVPTTDILEKLQKEIEEWLKDPGINC